MTLPPWQETEPKPLQPVGSRAIVLTGFPFAPRRSPGIVVRYVSDLVAEVDCENGWDGYYVSDGMKEIR